MEWTVSDIITLLGIAGTALVSLGAGLRWVVSKFEASSLKLEENFKEQIKRLQNEIDRMRQEHESELAIARQERDRWLGEVWRLRTALEANGVPVPDLGGPD